MLIRGVIRGTRQGFAFLAPEEGGEEIYIAEENLFGAIHGDVVEVELFRRYPHDFRPEGIVEKIVERTRPFHTGNVIRLARTAFVVPDAPVLPPRIRLRTGKEAAPEGSKVIFRLEEPARGEPHTATLERILGDAEDPSLDAVVVATNYQLPGRFPDDAIEEAMAAAARTDAADAARRQSYRDRLVLTIDPETAKDFDDAISLQKDPSGYHLQVHIADVSWLVAEGGPLDREAARRGNSVYFPGGVIPMLPEVLSTRAASLVPGEERRVLTAEIDLNPDGIPRASRLCEGVIQSGARLHYEQAQRMLEEEEGDSEVRASLRQMAELARLLRRRRFTQGGFDLEVPETEMRLDAKGMPVALWRHRAFETNRMIEEFMILANRAVGRFVVDRGMPLLFRVHGEPDTLALERFAEIALTLVPGTTTRDVETLPSLRRFLGRLPAGPLTRIVHSFFLRSLKQAVYSPVDVGHFGLGIDTYCHFTSPIRRYPDLFNHRVVRWLIQHPRSEASRSPEARRWHEAARGHALTSSKTERAAEQAEREIVRLKILRWAEARLGEVHWGWIIGMNPAGLFVEFEDVPAEGFIPRAGLRPGARFDEERFAFVEGRSRMDLYLGDRVEVQIERVSLRERHLDLKLLRRERGPERPAAGAAPRRRRKEGTRKRDRRAAPKSKRVKREPPRAERKKRGPARTRKIRGPRRRSGGKR